MASSLAYIVTTRRRALSKRDFMLALGLAALGARSAEPAAGLKAMNQLTENGDLLVRLARAGLRPTRQRLQLGALIFGGGDRHFTAELLHADAVKLRYPPSLATIYNTLNQLVDAGLLREIAVYDSKIWYDTKSGPHCHYYWEDTGELTDIPDARLPDIAIPPPPGARIEAIDIIVRVRANADAGRDPEADLEGV
jgi:Fur family transcriptional regulator, iron response regulator